MSWTATNPVSIGSPTRKSHYDKLWDNLDYLKDSRDDTDEDSYAAFTADDTYKVHINGNDALEATATAFNLGIGAATQMGLSQYGNTIDDCTKLRCYGDIDGIADDNWTNVTKTACNYDDLTETNPSVGLSVTEAGVYLAVGHIQFQDSNLDDKRELGGAIQSSEENSRAYFNAAKAANVHSSVALFSLMDLAATDYIGLYAWADLDGISNPDLDVGVNSDECFMAAHRLS